MKSPIWTVKLFLGRRERGVGNLTILVFGTVVAALLYAGYQILPFYYYYYELQNQMDALARVAGEETDKSIREKLTYHIKKMELPVDPSEDLVVERVDGKIHMLLEYEEVFYIPFQGKDYTIHVFPFRAEVEREL